MIQYKYKLRADCPQDCITFLLANQSDIRVSSLKVDDIYIPDTELTFWSFLPLDKVKVLLKEIQDGHVMVETVAEHEKYTGVRIR